MVRFLHGSTFLWDFFFYIFSLYKWLWFGYGYGYERISAGCPADGRADETWDKNQKGAKSGEKGRMSEIFRFWPISLTLYG